MTTSIDASEFWRAMKRRGFDFWAGVPDSTFGPAYGQMLNDPDIRYVPAVREDVALGVASAAYFMGRRGAVIMQNSGLGNVVNGLTSYSLMYKVPVLLLIGWRGYGGPPNDAPEHWIMGAKTTQLLDLLEIPHATLDPEGWEAVLDRLVQSMDDRSIPGALVVRSGVLK